MRGSRTWTAAAALSFALAGLHSDGAPSPIAMNSRMGRLPRLTVWAWERREDLRSLDPATTAVAYLDRTLTLDDRGLAVAPRRQPLLLPASTTLVRIPVVRIETGKGAILSPDSAEAAAAATVAAIDSRSAALQIDFDARRSEREWYADVLRRVRAKLPAEIPLSITALASWCSYDSAWMRGLPVDEAVPMLFRMEPDRRQAAALGLLRRNEFAIREPICSQSVGISTHEHWPVEHAGKRVYIFPDAGWQRDGLKETVSQLW